MHHYGSRLLLVDDYRFITVGDRGNRDQEVGHTLSPRPGDVDSDGVPDALLSDPGWSDGASANTGAVYVTGNEK